MGLCICAECPTPLQLPSSPMCQGTRAVEFWRPHFPRCLDVTPVAWPFTGALLEAAGGRALLLYVTFLW